MNSELFEIFRDDDLVLGELVSLGWCRTDYHRLGGLRSDGRIAYEIGYLARGAIEWLTEDGLDEAGPGSILIDWPGEFQGGEQAIVHPCERYWLRFNFPPDGALPGIASETAAALAASFGEMRARHFPASQTLKALFAQLLAQQRDPGRFATESSRAAFHQILFQTEADYHADLAETRSSAVQAALDYIEAHLDEDCRVEAIAAQVGLSVGYFHAVFAAEMGVSPASYHTRRRIAVARALLIASPEPITTVSTQLGFSSSQYFATAFKKLVGLTPSAYRAVRHGQTEQS